MRRGDKEGAAGGRYEGKKCASGSHSPDLKENMGKGKEWGGGVFLLVEYLLLFPPFIQIDLGVASSGTRGGSFTASKLSLKVVLEEAAALSPV